MAIITIIRRFIASLIWGTAPTERDDDYGPYDSFLGDGHVPANRRPLHQVSLVVFEEIVQVDTPGIQQVLRHTDMDILRIALFGASDAVRRAVLSRMARRSGRLLWEELAVMEPVPTIEVTEAQQQIVVIAASLAAEMAATLAQARDEGLESR